MPRKTHAPAPGVRRRAAASMRPRPDAAENMKKEKVNPRVGKASMRPRPDAAENAREGGRPARTAARFNEAAARCRGKRAVTNRRRAAEHRLQ